MFDSVCANVVTSLME